MIDSGELSKFEIVRRYLLDELSGGKYAPGAPFPSENELARQLGICKNTVREAFSGLVGEGRLVRKRGLGTFVGNASPKNVDAYPKVLWVMVGDYLGERRADPFILNVLAGLHAELDSAGFQILVQCVPDSERGAGQLKYFPRGRIDAMILAGFDCSEELLEKVCSSGVHAAMVGRPPREVIPFAHTDHVAGMRQAVDFLLRNGHRGIALVDDPAIHALSYNERQEGFLQAMSAANVVPDARLMITGCTGRSGRGSAAVEKLEQRGAHYTAAIVYGDTETISFRMALEERGIRVPDQVSLVSYTSGFAAMPDLTRVTWNVVELARAAARMVLKESPETMCHLYPTELFKGETVRSI